MVFWSVSSAEDDYENILEIIEYSMLQYINSAYMNTDVLAGEKDTVLADSTCSRSKSDLCASWPEQVCTIFATKS
jgi:hypothetical protein